MPFRTRDALDRELDDAWIDLPPLAEGGEVVLSGDVEHAAVLLRREPRRCSPFRLVVRGVRSVRVDDEAGAGVLMWRRPRSTRGRVTAESSFPGRILVDTDAGGGDLDLAPPRRGGRGGLPAGAGGPPRGRYPLV